MHVVSSVLNSKECQDKINWRHNTRASGSGIYLLDSFILSVYLFLFIFFFFCFVRFRNIWHFIDCDCSTGMTGNVRLLENGVASQINRINKIENKRLVAVDHGKVIKLLNN